jgi:hypothetical protein
MVWPQQHQTTTTHLIHWFLTTRTLFRHSDQATFTRRKEFNSMAQTPAERHAGMDMLGMNIKNFQGGTK